MGSHPLSLREEQSMKGYTWKDKKVLVVGGGLSGLAVCSFLQGQGALITLFDSKKAEDFPQSQDLARQGVSLLLDNQLPVAADWDIVVKSPGVPQIIPVLKMVRQAGILVISELELAWDNSDAPFIAVTGTNGKTTTTSLIGYILELAGKKPLVGGNIGRPLVEAVEGYEGVVVAEVSSFQLEDCHKFAPKIAVFLNLTPDHLDRHGDMESYLGAKLKIFSSQKENDFAVLNYDDPYLQGISDQIKCRKFFFSLEKSLSHGIFCEDGLISIALEGKINRLMAKDELLIKGRHNLENALAALGACLAYGVQPEIIAQGLREFKGVEHRLEFVAELEGVKYINDSKGTNPDSTIKALEAYDEPIILIAGGRDKGGVLEPLLDLIKQKVKYLVLVGEAKPLFQEACDNAGFDAYGLADSLEEAVALAKAKALPGDVVMLSPACASWDMFKNFEERGRFFKSLVLEGGKGGVPFEEKA